MRTTFWDGLTVCAAPDPTKDLPTARRWGYGEDTTRLCQHHDLFHCLVAEKAFGWRYSPTLRHVATHGREAVESWRREAEEWVVLQTQSYVVNDGRAPKIPAYFTEGIPVVRLRDLHDAIQTVLLENHLL